MNHLSNLSLHVQTTFEHLPLEILINVTEFLFTKDILNLSICSKYLHNVLYAVKIDEKVNFDTISRLSYFDSFTNVMYRNYRDERFPKSLCVLYWYCIDIVPKLPITLKSLYISVNYNEPLTQLPNSLEDLYLGRQFNHPLVQLPDSLKSLQLSTCYTQSLPQFPDSLESLNLGYNYDHRLPLLPNSLKYLDLGDNYNYLLLRLPDSLVSLKLGYSYTQRLPQLPISLKYLNLGWLYNHPLSQLPDSLESLILGCYYNQPISTILQNANSLRYLKVRRGFLLPSLSDNIKVEFF